MVAAAALIAFGDVLFFDQWIGATLGGFALAWTMIVALAGGRARGKAWIVALAVAALLGGVLIDDPSLLGWTLFWTALSLAALLKRRGFDDAASWASRLSLHVIFGLAQPILDLRKTLRARPRAGGASLGGVLKTFALPLGGGALFLGLFAAANPLIANAFSLIALPEPFIIFLHLLLWLALLFAIWPSLRPHPEPTRMPSGLDQPAWQWRGPPLGTITLSLIVFNAVFALQNGMDVAFLWSGAALPEGVTLADYAHRGAYPLIATALLAGLFVLVVFRPGTAGAQSPLARRLVILWTAQNVLLVASSILRTIDYVAAYSLTVLRIAALAWMALVALGLGLIAWRLVAGKSARWLVNANALAAALMLIAASMIDLGAVAARWNVRHARDLGGQGAPIDLCYLRSLGPSALLPLIAIERSATSADLRDRARAVRVDTMAKLVLGQSDWHGWTWRNARRLARTQALLGPHPVAPSEAPNGRLCDGSKAPPPPPDPADSSPAPPPVPNDASAQPH
jgi:hypothetical protein